MRWANEHAYAIRTTLKRFWQQPFSSFLNWLVMSFVLSVPIIGLVFIDFLNPIVVEVRSDPQVMVFVRHDASAADVETLFQKLKQDFMTEFSSVQYKSKDTALTEWAAQEQWRDIVNNLPSNPFPDAFILLTRPGYDAVALEQALVRIKAEPLVESILSDQDWIQRLDAIIRFAQTALVFLTSVVVVGVSVTVFNTVRMQALAQKKEILVLRLIGATESFVRRPFIYFGALSCCIAWLMAVTLVSMFIGQLNYYLNSFVQSYGVVAQLELPSIDMLLMYGAGAMLLGAISAMWSMFRTTRH